MKFRLLTLICLLAAVAGYSQTPFRNTEKYWWYRYRLVNDFMKIGDQCGESIPATTRWQKIGAIDQQEEWDGLHWGDATQHLGKYINMLAGEQAMLRSNHMSTSRTNMELYYALNAFERLDKNAEEYCDDIDANYPCKAKGAWKYPTKNGFFIRDDVPYYTNLAYGYEDFVRLNRDHFNRPGIVSSIPVNNIRDCDFKRRVHLNDPTAPLPYPVASQAPPGTKRMPVEESHDQIVGLYAGMAMATRLVDNTATYNGENLTQKAGRDLFNLINYIPNGDNIFAVSEWIIRNPTTGNRVIGIGSGALGSGGELFTFYSNGAVPGLMQTANNNGVTSNEINDLKHLSNTFGYSQAWQTTQFIGPGTVIGTLQFKDGIYADTYACFADNWRVGVHIGPFIIGYNSTEDKIKAHALKESFCHPQTPLMYRLVSGPGAGHGTDLNVKDQPSYPTLLNGAPFCGCHNYHSNTPNNPSSLAEYGNWYWSSDNLFQDYDRRGAGNDGADGDFNNLDYMTIYNLFILNEKTYLSEYFNSYYLENFSAPFYGISGTYGSRSQQLKLNYLEYLSLENAIKM